MTEQEFNQLPREKKIVSDKGFISEFYAILGEAQEKGEKVTHEEVFEMLNELHESTYGVYKFPSYHSFRRRRDRKK